MRFLRKGPKEFFDLKVFNPNAQRHLGQSLAQCYISNEIDKKRSYCERVLEVENGTFVPLNLNCIGGMGPECLQFYKRLSGLWTVKCKFSEVDIERDLEETRVEPPVT